MEFVAARFGLGGQDSSDGLAEFGVVVLSRHLRLSHRIQARVDDDDAQDGVLIVRAIQFVSGAAEVLAVDENLLTALRIFRGRVAPADEL